MLETWRVLPWLARAGLVVMGAGLVVDVTLHGSGAAIGPEHTAHAVILVGMALILGGIILDGASRARQHPGSRT